MRKITGLHKRGEVYHFKKTISIGRQKVVLRESTGTKDRNLAEQIMNARVQEETEALVHGKRFPFTFDHAMEKLSQEHHGKDLAMHLNLLHPYLGEVVLSEFHMGHPQMVKFLKDRESRKNNTINRSLEFVRLMLNRAATEWRDKDKTWIAEVPKVKLLPRMDKKSPDRSESGGYPISKGRERAFFRLLPIHVYLPALFIVNTGCREKEGVFLRWEWERRMGEIMVFDLPAHMSKNGRPRRLFCNSIAQEVVDACRGDHPERVFTYKGKPFTKLNNTAWKRARKQVGLENVRGVGQHFRVHDLRHTCATRLRECGVGREDRKDILGHVNNDITTHYSAAETSHLIACVERLVHMNEKPNLYVIGHTGGTVSDLPDANVS